MAIIGDTQFYFIAFFLWLVSRLLLQQLLKKPTKPNLRLPPSPPALPFIGHIHLFSPVASKCFHNISSKHGPLLYLRLGSRPLLLVSSASFAAEIFKTNDLAFSEKPETPFDDGLLFGSNTGFVTAPYGDYWKFMKKLCVTELLGASQLERSRGVRHEELRRFLHNLVEKAYKNENIDVGQELMKLTNNTTCRMVMSTRCSEEDDEAQRCRELVEGSIALTGKLLIASMLGPLKKFGYWLNRKQLDDIPKRYDDLFEKIWKEHEERAKRECEEREDKDLMDILLKELFIGGTDTAANTLQWTMAEIINHPNVFRKLREEIESVVGTNRLVEDSDIPNLHYLQAVVKETLRLYPLVPAIPRKCREDCQIGGFDVPKETAVIVNAYSIMRDPELWDNPDKFYPERFLKEQESRKETKKQNFNFLPFGGGRRMRSGSQLAFSVMNINVASMVQCFDWKVAGDEGKVNMEAKAGFTTIMEHPLLCLPMIHFNPVSA
ncbi:hypothetical protein P3X46_026583 [Hevea brasiliensis]|uniref:Cytochrome P450 n=1 Tax=Hevea brasiliensis TaxID=3981 RepID=A0ABQ9L0I6_HEVBR|nr:hypothetical protein P3X46_026583 [Hevea brasiliensis]